jgi:hypothetical protein
MAGVQRRAPTRDDNEIEEGDPKGPEIPRKENSGKERTMTKLYEHPTIPETKELPELPHGVVVPDDISGLEFPEEPGRRPGTKVRWLRWMAVAVLVAAGAIVTGIIIRDDTTTTVDTTSSYELVQDSIDQALLANQATTVDTTTSAYQLIQDSIDQALLENQ